MKVVIPACIKVGGFDYSIKADSENDVELKDNDNWGEHSGRLRQIRIQSDCTPQQFSQTFLHEILHAIDTVYQGVKLSNEEITSLSSGLFQVLEQLDVRFVKGVN